MRGFAVTVVIAYRAAVRQQEVDALRAIERTAAAQRDDRINLHRGGEVAPALAHIGVRVHVEFVKGKNFDARRR
jgi:hypothetical protein